MTVQKTMEFPQLQFSDKALTMSSWSLVEAKMQVKVSIGSRAILGENIETSWVTFVWRLALSMLRVSVRGLSCRVTLRLRACPLLYSTAEACGDSTGAVLGPGARYCATPSAQFPVVAQTQIPMVPLFRIS